MRRESAGRGPTWVGEGGLRLEGSGSRAEEDKLPLKWHWRCQIFERNGGLITWRAA